MVIPWYVTAIVLAAGGFTVVAAPAILAGGSSRARLGLRAAVVLGVTLGGWLVTTSLLALAGFYRARTDEIIPALPLGILVGLGAFGLAMALAPSLRKALTDPAQQSKLVAFQVNRIVGVAFIAVLFAGGLPAHWAAPAGIGDVVVGLSAPYVARNLGRRRLAIGWHLLGLVDLATALVLGALSLPGRIQVFFQPPTAVAISEFPLAVIITFIVPLAIGLHVVGLRYLLTMPRTTLDPTRTLETPGDARAA